VKKIFITGAAGFIGFHLALCLKKRGDFVIGLDNFNSYYDPQLKIERAQQLKNHEIEVVDGNICNQALLEELLKKHEITHIAHLAAQAGVRHSILAPEDYVASNLKGFVSVLEACRKFPHIKLTYASSSSVYGLNKKIPFSVEDPTDQPANFYGATKKANELIAFSYHHLYNLSITGLRYFTVYGPWGRPDMAYYLFAKKISNGTPIQVFNSGKMKRDFTYIDDIVQGTVAAIDLQAPYEIFNLGGNNPIELTHLIEVIEDSLGIKAIKEMKPMQQGEVLETYADIEKSKKILNYHPQVSLEEGISRFIDWFKDRSH
jgi:UDP-glucuronate 4-epimerase